jgi:hypothetical protein
MPLILSVVLPDVINLNSKSKSGQRTFPIMTRDVPKFWDDKRQKVVEDVVSTFSPHILDWGEKTLQKLYHSTDTGTQEICKTPTQLADILGTYVWVYSGDPEFSGDVEEMNRSYCKDDKDFIATHSIILGTAKNYTGRPAELENVNGHIAWGTAKVEFDGVRRVRERWSSDVAVPWTESYWEVLLTEDENSEPWLDMEGNAVGAAAVLDDNGYPFLVFDWHHPYAGHGSWSGYYVGKRLVEGKEWRFTDKERSRLGIGRTFESVAQFAKEGRKGVYEEEEDDSDEEDVDASGSSGEDAVSEEDAGESSGENAVSEDVGEKRKASNGQTGANKRRRA